jgi:hypothetical protein
MPLREVPPTLNGTCPASFTERLISRGFAVGATKESFVSGVDGRKFNRRLGGKPFDTSDGRSRWSSLTVPSSAWELIFPVVPSMKTPIGLGAPSNHTAGGGPDAAVQRESPTIQSPG